MNTVLNTKYIYNDFYVEKRKSVRADFLAKVDFHINERPGSSDKKMLLINISKNGGLLSGNENILVRDRIDIIFKAPFADFKEIMLSGTVVRIDDNRTNNTQYIGVMFNKNIYSDRINDFVRDINKGYYCSQV